MHRLSYLALVAGLALPACGDDISSVDPDADVEADASTADASVDPDAADPGVTANVIPLSEMGADGLYALAYAPDGSLYASGFRAETLEDPATLVLAKLTPEGELDTTFGDGGLVTDIGVDARLGERGRGIAVQSTGNIVVAGTVTHSPAGPGVLAEDRDILVARFTPEGELDDTFGDGGTAVLDFNTAVLNGDETGIVGADEMWNLSVYDDDKLLIHGAQRSDEAADRTDTDWVMARLTADGELDDTFAGDGVFTLDIQDSSARSRIATILDDGSAVGAGYSNTPGLGSTQAVLYKVTPDGELDPSFGEGGVFHEIVLQTKTEAYGAVAVGDALVTTGYGQPTADDANHVVSLRVTADGELDTTWGDDGAVVFDHAGFGNNGRNITALPDGRVLMVGSTNVSEEDRNGLALVLDADGALDPSFGDGGKLIVDLGGTGDVFWSVAVAPDGSQVALAGVRAVGDAATATDNDDAVTLILPLD